MSTKETKLKISESTTQHGIMSNGYKRVYIPDRGRVLEHRYVIENNIGRKLSKGEIIHHKNGNKLDNTIDNLEITTRSAHRTLHKDDSPRGEDLPQAKLTEKNIVAIRQRYADGGITQQELADEYGVGQDNISRIVNEHYWKHIKTTIS